MQAMPSHMSDMSVVASTGIEGVETGDDRLSNDGDADDSMDDGDDILTGEGEEGGEEGEETHWQSG